MQYKSIFAYLSKPSRVPQVINIATTIAGKSAAHLIGCHVMVEPSIPVYDVRAADLMQPIIEQQKDLGKKNADTLKKLFETTARNKSISFGWDCDEYYYHDYSNEIIERVRGGDLVIVSQYDENDGQGWKNLPARIAINSGRPVLVVPFKGEYSGSFDNIVIAWNNSRESTRAIYDSLPILAQAQNIKIVAVTETSNQEKGHALRNILLALQRHGLTVEYEPLVADNSRVPDMLYSAIGAYKADLCVMGCYGRSRMREIIFGGVTKEILKSMPIPILLSH